MVTSETKLGAVTTVDPLMLSGIEERESQIAIGEILAVAYLLQLFGRLMNDTSMILFEDNIGVVFTIVNGCSRFADLGTIAYGIQAAFVQSNITPWVEHVASWTNPSDGGSRDGVDDAVAAKLGVPLRERPLKPLPNNFPRCALDKWLEWYA